MTDNAYKSNQMYTSTV